MKDRIPDQAEKLRQLVAGQDAASGGDSATAVLEPQDEAPPIAKTEAAQVDSIAEKKHKTAKASGNVEPKISPENIIDTAPTIQTAEARPAKVDTKEKSESKPEAKTEKLEVKVAPVEKEKPETEDKNGAAKLSKKQKKELKKNNGEAKAKTSEVKAVDVKPVETKPSDAKPSVGSVTVEKKPEAAAETIVRPKKQPTLRIDPAKRFPMQSKTKVIAITGGKGGVGKTNLTCNLAIAMQRMNKRVIVMDADLSLANVDVLLGLTPRHNLSHVLSGQKTIQEIMVAGPEGLGVIPGGSGLEELSQLSDEQVGRLFDAFASLTPEPDVFLIDTAAGIHPNVLQFLLAADQSIVVTTPEPPAYTDAYALIKTLRRHHTKSELGVVINMAGDSREANDVARLMTQICTKMLGVGFNNLGYIPRDPEVLKAVRRQSPFLLRAPQCPASRAVVNLAASLLQIETRDADERGLRRFFRRLFQRAEHQEKASAAL